MGKKLNLITIPRRQLSTEIVGHLEKLILNNELSVGDTLPPERELAARLGVSRNILREAISKMVQKGLLEVRPGSVPLWPARRQIYWPIRSRCLCA
jgi:DNA-binding FadR family transcriptional regulator